MGLMGLLGDGAIGPWVCGLWGYEAVGLMGLWAYGPMGGYWPWVYGPMGL